jgi:hypothetical protein
MKLTEEQADSVGREFVRRALAEIQPDHGQEPVSLQGMIDSVADHNQLMLDCMADVLPAEREEMAKLMASDSQVDYQTWVQVAVDMFDAAERLCPAKLDDWPTE